MQVWGNKNSLYFLDFPGSSVDKNPPADARDMDSTPDWGRFHSLHAAVTEAHTPRGPPRRLSGRESTCQCRRLRRCRFDPWVGKIPWREMATHSRILAWKIPWTVQPCGPQSMGVTNSHTQLATERACTAQSI